MSTSTIAEPNAAQRVEIVLSQLRDLPPLPAVAGKLLALTGNDDSDIREIVSLIEMDPPLAAKVISLTRKASLGVRGEVSTVERAVLLLGMTAIRNLVLAIQVVGVFGSERDTESGENGFDRPEFWKHCLAVGCAAELLAGYVTPPVQPQEAFVCGLLHDLGKIALDTILPKSYERVFRLNASRMGSLPDLEREIIGVDHMVVGRRLGQLWRLPDEITACLWLHHHPPRALPASVEHAAHIHMIYVADNLVRELGLGLSGNYVRAESAAELLHDLGVGEEDRQRIIHDLAEHIAQRADLIDARELTSEKLYLDALSQANRDLNKLNVSLNGRNQDLEFRSKLLDAVTGLSEELVPSDPIPTVCQHSAAALRRVIPAERIAVCSRPGSGGLFHVGLVDETGPRSESSFVSEADAAVQLAIPSGRPTPAGRDLPKHLELVRSRMGDAPLWLIPIDAAGGRAGTILISVPSGSESELGQSLEQIRPLLSTIGLALVNARSRKRAQRMAEDLSEANRRLHESQHRLLRQRTLGMIGEMASGAAHELNNPLAVISGRAQMLAGQNDPEKVQTYAKIIHEQSHRCSAIVTELLQFASPPSPNPEQVRLRPMLIDLRDELVRERDLSVERFELSLSDDNLSVWADPSQIRQALFEILSNAQDAATPGREQLHVNCSQGSVDEKVVIAVRDNGRGMTADVIRRAFDPFFSDRPAGRGRGMGLCHAYRMVEINGGQLRLESIPGEGTTARMWLPMQRPESGSG